MRQPFMPQWAFRFSAWCGSAQIESKRAASVTSPQNDSGDFARTLRVLHPTPCEKPPRFLLLMHESDGAPMKRILATLLLLVAASGIAIASDQKPNGSILGTWSVDTSRLPMAPGARPKSVTISFSLAGQGQLSTIVEVIDPTGNRLLATADTPLDGAPTSVKSNFEADASATTLPRPDVLIMQLGKNGHPTSTRIYTLNADGASMIETVATFGADSQPVLRQNYFSRVR